VSCGTELSIVQEGIPEVIPPEACYLGWQESLTLLARLGEADIPDQLRKGSRTPRETLAILQRSPR
jgi:hypothetical protein